MSTLQAVACQLPPRSTDSATLTAGRGPPVTVVSGPLGYSGLGVEVSLRDAVSSGGGIGPQSSLMIPRVAPAVSANARVTEPERLAVPECGPKQVLSSTKSSDTFSALRRTRSRIAGPSSHDSLSPTPTSSSQLIPPRRSSPCHGSSLFALRQKQGEEGTSIPEQPSGAGSVAQRKQRA